MEYLHPSVSSQIVDNSTVFLSAQGITQLFCAFTSDIGPDNVITPITSPSEYEFHYGVPNMRKHGQAAYNIMNWLNAHGGLYALRVMPENAGYSHAFVNIQSKSGSKHVIDANGDVVSVPDVTLRTTVTYTGVNNISAEALESELTKSDRPDTVDGFKNHVLFGVFPKGRGKKYDNLGFRLTLTDSLDETYGFRLYNFETTKTADNGSTAIVEGPFLVSLAPEAISASNESMFIKYVVEKYSTYYNVIFNEAAYEELGAIINPDVNPALIDFISGRTREIGGKAETRYNAITKQEEDTHLSLHKYNSAGQATGELNIVDADNSVEASIVSIDDNLRLNVYNEKVETVNNMKVALSKVRNDAYATHVDAIATVVDTLGVKELTAGTLKDANTAQDASFTAFSNALAAYTSTANDANLNTLKAAASDALAKTEAASVEIRKALDAARAIGDSTETLNVQVSLYDLATSLSVADIKSAKTASNKAAAISAEATLGAASTSNDNSVKLAAAASALSSVDEVLAFAKSIQVEDLAQASAAITSADSAFVAAETALELAQDPNQLASEVDGNVNSAVTAVASALVAVKKALDLAMLEVSISTVEDVDSKLDSAVTDILTAVFAAKATVAGAVSTDAKKALADAIAANIAAANTDAVDAKQDTYDLSLHNFNNFVPFGKGSDGDLDDSNATLKATTTKNLLIQAYKGTLDAQLTNKKLFPIDVVLDANYPSEVKNAITELCSTIRKDFIGIVDTGFQANPQQAIDWRQNVYTASTFYTSIFAQDFIVYDEYTGQDIKVTTPYFLASRIPEIDEAKGIHVPFVGPNNGVLSGFKKMSYNPTEPWKEQLYKKQINYVESDPRRTKLGSQLTSQTKVSALSNINNVRALLRIQREVEALAEDYQFEFNDDTTIQAFQYNLNGYLTKWTSNRACDSIKGTVFASTYDRQQKQVRVRIEMVFNSIIEKVLIDLVVNA